MTVIAWVVTVFLWIVAAAFTVSGGLLLIAAVNHRKDRELVGLVSAVAVMFVMFAAAAAWAALELGRGLV